MAQVKKISGISKAKKISGGVAKTGEK